MSFFSFNEVMTAWSDTKSQRRQSSPEFLIVQQSLLRSLASGQSVTAGQVAADTGLSLDTVRAHFAQFEACGAEVDDTGNVTGWILSLNPTPHFLYVSGRSLYAWCALDALFLPSLIGQPTKVESKCPATGTLIELTITPTGVTSVYPASTVLSIVVPGVSAVCAACQDGGVARAICYAMHFFSSREAAARWLGPHSDVAILTLKGAWQLAHAVWIEPTTKVLNAEVRQ